MNIEEHLLSISIRDTITLAYKAVQKLHYVSEGNTTDNVDEGAHADELDEATEMVRFYVEKVFRDSAILAKRLGLPRFRADISALRASFKDLADLVPTRYDVILHCPPLAAAQKMFDSLAAMSDGRAVTGLGVFESILENKAKIIEESGIAPKKEAEVRAEIRKIMKYSFRDVVAEIPLPSNIKTYKPDMGVRSLRAAAEYKFVDTQQEAKTCLEGVYADMRGYSGHHDWQTFYAVSYMTAPFYTQKEVDDEFRLLRADTSWTPIVVVGKGSRS